MKITVLTNEYPPHIYGGAGVHVEYLIKEFVSLDAGEIEVFSFGDQDVHEGSLQVEGVEPETKLEAQDPRHAKVLDTLQRDLIMAGKAGASDIVHCHTWYTHFAGCLVQQLQGAKLVLTTHSLEPHRPWKVEQLGSAYHVSSWLEKTAFQNADGVIAVSESMKHDVHELYGVPEEKIAVIPNGIDLDEYQPTFDDAVLKKYGIDPSQPFVLFVGRITRQKGILHLANALKYLPKDTQMVLCAGAPDTPEIGDEMKGRIEAAHDAGAERVIWLQETVPREDIIKLYSHAALFVCPSVYEPFGIINLEAMACETPVVASAVGGIPEIVVPGETGTLVSFDVGDEFEPADPDKFAHDLADAIQELLADPEKLETMGKASRKRVQEKFSWRAVAEETLEFYESLL